jgi:hypothetical protein
MVMAARQALQAPEKMFFHFFPSLRVETNVFQDHRVSASDQELYGLGGCAV